jgi:hypothetical protein
MVDYPTWECKAILEDRSTVVFVVRAGIAAYATDADSKVTVVKGMFDLGTSAVYEVFPGARIKYDEFTPDDEKIFRHILAEISEEASVDFGEEPQKKKNPNKEKTMFLVFDNIILNMDNVALIEPKERVSDDTVKILIATTAIHQYYGDLGSSVYTSSWEKEFVIKTKKWHELIEAIKKDEKVFVLNDDA